MKTIEGDLSLDKFDANAVKPKSGKMRDSGNRFSSKTMTRQKFVLR